MNQHNTTPPEGYPATTYNPGSPFQVSPPDQQSRSGEPYYQLPFGQQSGEVRSRNTHSQESGSAKNLPGPQPSSSISSSPSSSQEMSSPNYGTGSPVPQTPTTISSSRSPLLLSDPPSTDSGYYVPGLQVPTIGSQICDQK